MVADLVFDTVMDAFPAALRDVFIPHVVLLEPFTTHHRDLHN
jgi:pyruvate/2-oxoacid:ferredoxin oxidoreductase alpha subunit